MARKRSKANKPTPPWRRFDTYPTVPRESVRDLWKNMRPAKLKQAVSMRPVPIAESERVYFEQLHGYKMQSRFMRDKTSDKVYPAGAPQRAPQVTVIKPLPIMPPERLLSGHNADASAFVPRTIGVRRRMLGGMGSSASWTVQETELRGLPFKKRDDRKQIRCDGCGKVMDINGSTYYALPQGAICAKCFEQG
jgi:hypothetical protein